MQESSTEMEHSGGRGGGRGELPGKSWFSLCVIGSTPFRETVTLIVPQVSQKYTNQKRIYELPRLLVKPNSKNINYAPSIATEMRW